MHHSIEGVQSGSPAFGHYSGVGGGRATHEKEETEMANVQRSVEIKASPEETMALLSDASRWPDWYPGMTEIQVADPFPEKGGKATFKVKSAGMSMQITETVLDYQPSKLQLLQMEGMLSGQARWQLAPEGDGTVLTTTFDYALPGGVFGRIADALVVKHLNTKSLEEALHNFKALVERSPKTTAAQDPAA
jgi:carbon monoxide dehydrogenase subunit G